MLASPVLLLALAGVLASHSAEGQRITTIQLEGVQYFVSRMNPYSPELNYFLAYQFCRSIGLQLASFETKEKSQAIMDYLTNAGYNKYDFWTSGNSLGTDMLIWMSTGLPFNATFDLMRKKAGEESTGPVARQLSAVEQKRESGTSNGCVAMKAPDLLWDTDDCNEIKDFICEQTRCYYYNYGSIPVSSAQGRKYRAKVTTFSSTTTATTSNSLRGETTRTKSSEREIEKTTTPAEVTTLLFNRASQGTGAAGHVSPGLPLTPPTVYPFNGNSIVSNGDKNQTDDDAKADSDKLDADKVDASKLDQDQPDDDKPDQDKPDQDNPDQDKPDQDKPDEDKPDEDRLDEDKPDEVKPDEVKPDEDRLDEDKVDEDKPVTDAPVADKPDADTPWPWARNIMLEKPVLKKSSAN